MEIPRTLVFLTVVLSACTTGARAINIAGPPSPYKQRSLSWNSDGPRDMCVNFGMSAEHIEPDARVDGSDCARQRVQKLGIVVDEWYGRVGNNVYQVAHAIFAAKLSGNLRVDTPAYGTVRELFNFPETFDIQDDQEFQARVACEESLGSHFYLYTCSGVRRSDYTNVLRTYLLPHLSDKARDACKREEANTKRELVVHLRSGDLLYDSSWKGRMAPCSFVEKVLSDPAVGSFERIRVITEPDRKHPRLNYFVANKINVDVQSEFIAADGCAFMHAEHILYGAKSTFSIGLPLFNLNNVTVYDPLSCRKHGKKSHCPNGQDIKYCIPGMDESRASQSKIDFLLQYPMEKIWRDGVECFD